MPLMCIQCAMRAIADGKDIPTFEETSEQHVARYHADPGATLRERADLEKRIAAKLGVKDGGNGTT